MHTRSLALLASSSLILCTGCALAPLYPMGRKPAVKQAIINQEIIGKMNRDQLAERFGPPAQEDPQAAWATYLIPLDSRSTTWTWLWAFPLPCVFPGPVPTSDVSHYQYIGCWFRPDGTVARCETWFHSVYSSGWAGNHELEDTERIQARMNHQPLTGSPPGTNAH